MVTCSTAMTLKREKNTMRDKESDHVNSDTINLPPTPWKRESGFQRKLHIIRKGQWTNDEDRMLMRLVEIYGEMKWSRIAQMMPLRVGKQCRERWYNHLRPDIKKGKWSEEEEKILIDAHKQFGNKWCEIARIMLPFGRTENTIKNHWNATKRKQLKIHDDQNTLLQNYINNIASTSNHEQENSSSDPHNLQVKESAECVREKNIRDFNLNEPVSESYESQMEFTVSPESQNDFTLSPESQMKFDERREMDFFELLSQSW